MKAIKYFLLGALAINVSSCDLDTFPTDKLGTEQVTGTIEGCMAALDGVYRGFYTTQYSDGYGTENFGPASVNLAGDLMGDDFLMRELGSQWFVYDHVYWVRNMINNTSDRPYTWWNMYYQFINNANAVIDKIDDASGANEALRMNIKAQALALRAYAYSELAFWYQRTYVGNEDSPGVPIYTTATTIETEGKGRGKLSDVYLQINSDLDEAIELFEESGLPQKHKSHIDYHVACGLKSRVALVQEDWVAAEKAAKDALSKSSMIFMTAGELTSGFNAVANSEWLWGSEINETQSTSWFSFFNQLDAAAGGHGARARKLVSRWLYDMIDDTDVRKAWFVAPTEYLEFKDSKVDLTKENKAEMDGKLLPEQVSYNQLKFRVKSKGSWNSDYIYMRGAELALNRAEALCHLGNFSDASELMVDLIGMRYDDPEVYSDHIASLTKSKELTLKSTESTTVNTLMDEIILQRRIELWGEGFRIRDIVRLQTGFKRTYENSNISIGNAYFDLEPNSWETVMMIPISEFDGNPSLDASIDQNP